jgi:hypothetical protein
MEYLLLLPLGQSSDLRLGEFQVRHADGGRTGRVDACEPPQRLLVMLRDPDPRPGQPKVTRGSHRFFTRADSGVRARFGGAPTHPPS